MAWQVALLLFAVALGFATVGLGGGLLYFPLLSVFYPGWAPPTVVAITLACSVAALAPAANRFRRKGSVRWRPALAVALPLALCAHLGARFTLGAASRAARGLFAVVLLCVGVKMLLDLRRKDGEGQDPTAPPIPAGRMAVLALVAGAAGFLSGSVGIGGGVLLVPALVFVGRLPVRDAVGTASAALLAAATTGLATYLWSRQVQVSPWLGCLFVLATFLDGEVGSRLTRRLNSLGLRAVFTGLVFVAALWTGTISDSRPLDERHLDGVLSEPCGISRRTP